MRRPAPALLPPDELDWATFVLLAAAEYALPPESPEDACEMERWVRDGDPNEFREQQKTDPVAYECVIAEPPGEHRAVAAMVVATMAFLRAETRWMVDVKAFREDVAVRDRAEDPELVPGVAVRGGAVVVRTGGLLPLCAVVAPLALLVASGMLFLLSRVREGALAAVVAFLSVSGFRMVGVVQVDAAREIGSILYMRRRVKTCEQAADIVQQHVSVVWTTLLRSVLQSWPDERAYLATLWERKSRLADWLDAGAKTVVTREGDLALYLAGDTLLMLGEDEELVLCEREWDDWHERHFSFRRLLGTGVEDFNCTLLYATGDYGAKYDDNVSHIPATGLYRIWRVYLLVVSAWRDFSHKKKKGAISSGSNHLQKVASRDELLSETKYMKKVLTKDLIPAALPVRMSMSVSTETRKVLSPPFHLHDLADDGVYDQLFEFEKVLPHSTERIDDDTICLAISYRHHIGVSTNRMPRNVWAVEIPHLRALLRFYAAERVRFWTDTRLSKISPASASDEWEKVGLAPYGQMQVYIVNSHDTETMVDRFWLTAERKLGLALGGTHYATDDGKLTIATGGVEDEIDPAIVTALNGLLASSSVLGELYRSHKLEVVQKSIKKLEASLGREWKETVVSLPWGFTLFDFSHDFSSRQFDEKDIVLRENWNPAVDVLLSRRVLDELQEDLTFPKLDIETEVYLNTEETDGKSFFVVLRREKEQVAAVDIRARREGQHLTVTSVGKAKLVGPEFLSQLDEAGMQRIDAVF